jgi:hypothetical protein
MSALESTHFIEAKIGWTRGDGFVSKMIRRLDDSYFNHVYYVFTTKSGLRLIYESHLKGGVQITPYQHLQSAKIHGKVEAIEEVDLNLCPTKMEFLWNDCLPHHGDAYNTRQILIYYTWIRMLKRKPNPKIFKLEKEGRYTCNQLVVAAGKDVVPKLKDCDDTYTPEKLFRLFHDGVPSKKIFGS